MPETRDKHRTQRLFERARAGDERALDDLFAAASDPLLVFVRLRLGTELGAKLEPIDVVQETVVQALRSLDSFEPRGPGAFVGWLCRIAERQIHALADYHGARKRRPPAPEERVSRVLSRVCNESSGPRTIVLRRERNERLLAALEQLADDERTVLLLRHFQDLPIRDAAKVMGMSATATHRLLGRATENLGRLIGDTEASTS